MMVFVHIGYIPENTYRLHPQFGTSRTFRQFSMRRNSANRPRGCTPYSAELGTIKNHG